MVDDMRFNYSDLTPDLIMDALDLSGLRLDSGLIELNSYENRVYQFQDEERRRYVVKFYRPGRWSRAQILEEHDFAARLNEAEIPVAAPLSFAGETLLEHQGYPFAIWQSVGGRQFEVDNLDQLEWVGRYLGRIHQIGASRSFHHRVRLDVESMLHEPRELLASGEWLPSGLAKQFFGVLDELIKHVCDAMTLDVAQISLHGDCHPGNILWRDGPMFVDLDDCRTGPAIQDLWMMLSGERHEQLIQLDTLLAGYEEFMEFDPRELALIEPLRAMRIVHYMAWLARRWDDPAFPRHFPWFNTDHYWRQQIATLHDQLAALKAQPLTLTPGW
ncbi:MULTISPECIES: serine/threonine protein kinase [Aeromonas]|uniref:serine/threonine protein kinase n=1 Tax=Aeromonas TaxID=642 RepID=UPI00223EDE0E|nr:MULTISPECIES: serine/threonine protein kinase [Aeromonas]MDF2391336.1 serine/threonine protein kinase [Aeromonas sp. 2MA4]MDM5062823.1 serine/threonine protein kinase [Aeromonas salmonicida]